MQDFQRESLKASNPSSSVSWVGIVALLGLVAALYRPVLGFEFVNWDDPWYVLKNPLITSWHPANLWRIMTELSVKNYAPLTTLSLLIDHTLFGFDAGGYHLTNVLLHAANAVLAWMLVSRLSGSRSVGLATAALFAVHPVQIESVAWVSSRKTLLCSTCMLASGLCWLRLERTAKAEFWGTIWLLAALLAKAAAIVVPPIVLAYDLCVRRRTLADALPRQLLPGLLCLILLNITMSAQTTEMGGVRGHLELRKLHLAAVDAMILWQYVGLLIWPAELSVMYDPPTRGILVSAAMSMVAWLVVAAACWRARLRQPLMAWSVFTWFCLFFPVMNFFPITTLMNDRYLYLPCLCVFGLAAGGARWALRRVRQNDLFPWYGAAAVTAVLVVCSARTASHLPVWRSDLSLWRHAINCTPHLPVVQIQWADALYQAGDVEQAATVLRQALAEGAADEADRARIRRRLSEWES